MRIHSNDETNHESEEILNTSILKTRLFVPQVRNDLVHRPRLMQRLNAGLEVPLLLVSAQAGAGKTTILSEWVRQLALPFAWVSLDEEESDLARFFQYVCAALQSVGVNLDQAVFNTLSDPQPPPVEVVLTTLVNAITLHPRHFVLVLDDYHLIKSPRVHQALTFLVDHQPEQMHLVIATRSDPPLPLARLRGRRQMVEVRFSDLRFTEAEAADLLASQLGDLLSQKDIAALLARTEGWAVGLQMTALSMKRQADLPGFIAAFTGTHHFILDYLIEEVLHYQSAQVQDFLLATAVLDTLSGPLCEALIQDAAQTGCAAQEMLENLERDNLFIVPLDDERRWFRYHHLFGELLRNQLDRRFPGRAAELHQRASRWFEQQGQFTQAVKHAIKAGDTAHAATLLEAYGETLFNQGNMLSLLDAIRQIPLDVVRGRARLYLYLAWLLVLTGETAQAESILEEIERRQDHYLDEAMRHQSGESAPDTPGFIQGTIYAARAFLAFRAGDPALAADLSRQALEALPAAHQFMRGRVMLSLGAITLQLGNTEEGCRLLLETSQMAQAEGNGYTAVACLSTVGGHQLLMGRLHQARETLQRALDLATIQGNRRLPYAAIALVEMSDLYYEWNELQAALHAAEEAVTLGKEWALASTLVRGPLALARVLFRQGQVEQAWALFRQIQRSMEALQVGPTIHAQVDTTRVQFWLSEPGGVAQAAQWARAQSGLLSADDVTLSQREPEAIALAQVLVTVKRLDEAAVLLERLRRLTGAEGRLRRMVTVLALEAICWSAQGLAQKAVDGVEQALALAEPQGLVRTWMDLGTPAAELLVAALDRRKSPPRRADEQARPSTASLAYLSRLVEAFGLPRPRPDQVASPVENAYLSDRELEVLRCMAAGMSNADIARHLVIEVSTVKRHINHIFTKLDVDTRMQAILKARDLGLL